jgi:hypothetical protein
LCGACRSSELEDLRQVVGVEVIGIAYHAALPTERFA